jgi:hypothetical protein
LTWLERFSVWHIRVLEVLDSPAQWFAARNQQFPAFMTSSLGGVLTSAYPELRDQRAFCDFIAKDLWKSGLLNTDGLHVIMSAHGAAASRATEIAKQFLNFIRLICRALLRGAHSASRLSYAGFSGFQVLSLAWR